MALPFVLLRKGSIGVAISVSGFCSAVDFCVSCAPISAFSVFCNAAAIRVRDFLLLQGKAACSSRSGGYCKARDKIDEAVPTQWMRNVGIRHAGVGAAAPLQ